MNAREKEIMANGETGQGEGLMEAKMRNKAPSFKEKSYSNSKNNVPASKSPAVSLPLCSPKSDFHSVITAIFALLCILSYRNTVVAYNATCIKKRSYG